MKLFCTSNQILLRHYTTWLAGWRRKVLRCRPARNAERRVYTAVSPTEWEPAVFCSTGGETRRRLLVPNGLHKVKGEHNSYHVSCCDVTAAGSVQIDVISFLSTWLTLHHFMIMIRIKYLVSLVVIRGSASVRNPVGAPILIFL
jgi:hypothetical protein